MLLELVNNPDTDLVAVLEKKCSDNPSSFDHDTRVQLALSELIKKKYSVLGNEKAELPPFHYFCEQLTLLDNIWGIVYLSRSAEMYDQAAGYHNKFLSTPNIKDFQQFGYNPFKSINPVAVTLAYCDVIENSFSTEDLKDVSICLQGNLKESKNTVFQKVYPILSTLVEKRKSFISEINSDSWGDMFAEKFKNVYKEISKKDRQKYLAEQLALQVKLSFDSFYKEYKQKAKANYFLEKKDPEIIYKNGKK